MEYTSNLKVELYIYKISLTDVAKKANVTIQAVSRTLNGKSKSKKIIQTAQDLLENAGFEKQRRDFKEIYEECCGRNIS